MKIPITKNFENDHLINQMSYKQLTKAFFEFRRLYLLGFKHYLKSLYLIDEKLKQIDSQIGSMRNNEFYGTKKKQSKEICSKITNKQKEQTK